MAEFGEELRLERERQGLSLEKLSVETRIQARYLVALEAGEFHEMPGGIFRRGICRAYLSVLGLDEVHWMARFDRSLQEAAQSQGESVLGHEEAWLEFASNVKKSRTTAQVNHGHWWFGVFGMWLLLLGTGWLVWEYVIRGRMVK